MANLKIERELYRNYLLILVDCQYIPEIKGNFLNDHSSAGRAFQRFLILPLANSPRLSGNMPFPGCLAMTG